MLSITFVSFVQLLYFKNCLSIRARYFLFGNWVETLSKARQWKQSTWQGIQMKTKTNIKPTCCVIAFSPNDLKHTYFSPEGQEIVCHTVQLS